MRLVRTLAVPIAFLVVAGVTQAATGPGVGHVAKPAFPPRLARSVPQPGARLQLVSTRTREPSLVVSEARLVPKGFRPPRSLAGEPFGSTFLQPGTTLVVYGTGVIAGFAPRGARKYAYDLSSFGFPPKALVPRAYGPQEIAWARQLGRLLIVQTNHLGYASDSGGRNGYLTGIDLDTGEVRWRSPALVANARNFVVTRGLIVSGYGFTKEKDWLYLVDPATGEVRDRLALPSAAERISVSGDRIVVRCYDARVVARLAAA
jgi:hypothetical protein